MATVRADPILAGIYDPRRRGDSSRLRAELTRSLERFGRVLTWQAGPLVVGAAYPAALPAATSAKPVLCLLDGYLDNLEALDDRAGVETTAEAVIAELYARQGMEMFSRLRGAFALALWDSRRERGCLVRDQLGERPLFYYENGEQLYFATEISPLLHALPRRPAPDRLSVTHWLAWTILRENRTLYEGVRRLDGGCALVLDSHGWSWHRYWAPRYEPPLEGSPSELAEELRRQLTSATRRSLGGAQRAGILLSGGVDSTTVAAVANGAPEADDGELRAYSATFPYHHTADESTHIEAVTKRLGIEWIRMEVLGGSSFGGTLDHLDAWELPDISANGFFSRALSERAVDDGAEVLLTGEGGDQLFAAGEHLIADRLARARLSAVLSLLERFPNIAYHPWRSVRLRLLRDFGIYPLLPHPLHRWLMLRKEGTQLPSYLSDASIALSRQGNDPCAWRGGQQPRWWAAKADTFAARKTAIGAAEMTCREARMSRTTERNPLLTVDLVEFVLRLPPEHGFEPTHTRAEARRATAGLLPDAVRLSPGKPSFDAIRGYSLQAELPLIRDLLEDSGAGIREYTDAEAVRNLLDRVPETWGELSLWGAEVLRLLTTECWLRYQEDRDLPSRLLDSGRLAKPQLRFREYAAR